MFNLTYLFQYLFFQDLKKHTHVHWALQYLSLYGPSQPFDPETMHTIALCIPSVNSFFGKGHMNLS